MPEPLPDELPALSDTAAWPKDLPELLADLSHRPRYTVMNHRGRELARFEHPDDFTQAISKARSRPPDPCDPLDPGLRYILRGPGRALRWFRVICSDPVKYQMERSREPKDDAFDYDAESPWFADRPRRWVEPDDGLEDPGDRIPM